MLIKPLKCPVCHGQRSPTVGLSFGLPADTFPLLGNINHPLSAQCGCGHRFEIVAPRDAMMLSDNPFMRLGAASNHCESGNVEVEVGRSTLIRFKRPFDFPCRAFISPMSSTYRGSVFAKEVFLMKQEMLILTSAGGPRPLDGERITINYFVYGLVDINTLKNWEVLLYSGIANQQNDFFKPALMDYAISFEAFVEMFLARKLSETYNADVSEYLLRKTSSIEGRCKELLELATGHRLSEQNDVYQPWDLSVRTPRNHLAHGEILPVGRQECEIAYQAVYQAVRWIQELK